MSKNRQIISKLKDFFKHNDAAESKSKCNITTNI